jgi:hypothetical protein
MILDIFLCRRGNSLPRSVTSMLGIGNSIIKAMFLNKIPDMRAHVEARPRHLRGGCRSDEFEPLLQTCQVPRCSHKFAPFMHASTIANELQFQEAMCKPKPYTCHELTHIVKHQWVRIIALASSQGPVQLMRAPGTHNCSWIATSIQRAVFDKRVPCRCRHLAPCFPGMPVDLCPRHGGVHMLKTLWLKTGQFQGAM